MGLLQVFNIAKEETSVQAQLSKLSNERVLAAERVLKVVGFSLGSPDLFPQRKLT